jgi:uncharacterized protein
MNRTDEVTPTREPQRKSQRLEDVALPLEALLARRTDVASAHTASAIRRETVRIPMRDGVCLATDLYLPAVQPAPAIAVRTPYGRAEHADLLIAFATRGYVAVAQDCRGTGDSEPDFWDYYVYESEDSIDFVDWVTGQKWFDGFLGSIGASYFGGTQWCMAIHPAMSAIAPEVSGLGVVMHPAREYMFLDAYVRTIGEGEDKVAVDVDELEHLMHEQTLAGGYFNDPIHWHPPRSLSERYPQLRGLSSVQAQCWLREHYARLSSARRAEFLRLAVDEATVTVAGIAALSSVIPYDAHLLPRVREADLVQSLQAPALMITGWYDWFLDDSLTTWEFLTREAREPVRSRSRLLITPSAHNAPGYHEGREDHPELERTYRTEEIGALLLHWHDSVRADTLDSWPAVIYYLMGANEWYASSRWPPADAEIRELHLAATGGLLRCAPRSPSEPDSYVFDPRDPTPTVGGSIISHVYTPGSVDVSEVQRRSDVLTYTTDVLERDLDVVGPLRLILYASSSALDTDFYARISDVFPDGRAIQLQNGMRRARNRDGEPELLEPGRVYRFEIDMWATANRFKAGHRLRLDVSSADFPRFERNSNRGGEPGPPIPAKQTIYHDPGHPSKLLVPVIGHWLDEHQA